MRTILNDLLNLLFPRLCLLCHSPLVEGEEHICLRCLSDLPYIAFKGIDNNPAMQLFAGKTDISHAYSFLHYEKGGKVQQLIHSVKYNDNKELGFWLGRLAASECMKSVFPDTIDLIIPVPLHPAKLKQRGYNQSEWIARGVCSATSLPTDNTSIHRAIQTETQTHKQIYERWINVKDVFSVVNPEKLQGKHILLIDDVATTGSTIEACAQTLLKVSGVRISVFTLAVV